MISKSQSFIAVTSEGGLLPSDFLQELLNPKSEVKGLDPKSYDLSEGERVNEQVNRSWNRLKGCWDNFKRSIADKDLVTATTTETRERWLLPLFQELGFGRLKAAKPLEIDGKSYGISHGIQLGGGDGKSSGVYVPLHLVGSHVDLDRRTPGAVGAAKASPHSVTQQVLNARDDMLWGIVSNGYILRLLRDNVALTRLSRLDFDLQQIFDGDLYSEFYLLWLVTHRSRFEAERPEQCILEQWKKTAEDKGLRALDNLRPGVEKAIVALGAGLVGHRKNEALREKLRTGALTPQGLYQQVLRVIYRLLFLLVTEDRDLFHPREDSEANRKGRKRYRDFYSITRLRGMTLYRAGTPHPDLWQVLQLVSRKLGSDKGCPELALPALGSFLWTVDTSTPDLKDCLVGNRQVLEAIHALVFVQDGDVRRTVDYKNLGAEELGSVYESLLELHPQINPDAGTFDLQTAAGHERKTTGSYYTPDSLVQCLLDSALDPVVVDAIKGKDGAAAEKAILSLKVCDPACGSGHFAIAAAYRLARRLASIRSGGDEPSPEVYRAAIRDVIGHCIYAVDINAMAVELCRINLWLESMVPGKPLSFLDHHIRVGNSLLGTTPDLVAAGLPDTAFDAIEGDDKKACTALRKRNKGEREGIGGLFVKEDQFNAAALQQAASALDELPADRPEDISRKEEVFLQNERAYDFQTRKRIFDTWCAAFVIPKVLRQGSNEPFGITQRHLTRLSQGDDIPEPLGQEAEQPLRLEVDRLARTYSFFHWHLAFPDVFGCGGFDVILGNPPWERVKLEEKQWFESRCPEIAEAKTASLRKAMIRQLEVDNPGLLRAFLDARRTAEAESSFLRSSGRYPLSGIGDVNTYAVFTELATTLVGTRGMAGIIIPTGLLTDDQLKGFSSRLIETGRLTQVNGFENEEFLFPGIANVVRFCAVAISGKERSAKRARMAFYMRKAEHLLQEERFFSLSPEELTALNPKTRTSPVFRTERDARLTLALYRRFPVLGPAAPGADGWGITYLRMFDMANDSNLFLSEPAEDALPLYEAKLFWHYDHRFGSYDLKGKLKGKGGRGLPDMPAELHQDPTYRITTQFWVPGPQVIKKLEGGWSRQWLLAYRKTSSAKLERTVACTVLPISAVNDKAPIIIPCHDAVPDTYLLLSCLNSITLDYIARQKVGGTDIGYFHLDQLPVPRPSDFSADDRTFLKPRVLELVYTSWDMQPFARDLGYAGPPFQWDPTRRFHLQCEIDAFYARLYGLSRDELLFVLDPQEVYGPTFPGESFRVLKEKETERYGAFRTKDAILGIYDTMAVATKSGQPYQTRLDHRRRTRAAVIRRGVHRDEEP